MKFELMAVLVFIKINMSPQVCGPKYAITAQENHITLMITLVQCIKVCGWPFEKQDNWALGGGSYSTRLG